MALDSNSVHVNLSAPRPEGRGLPFDKLRALNPSKGSRFTPSTSLRAGSEPRSLSPPFNGGLRAVEGVN